MRRDAKRCAAACILFVALSASAQTLTNRFTREQFSRKLVAAAVERTHHRVRYVSDYVAIAYPGGDVPAETGVCTDEIIRIYRAVGIDLQKQVHEDMVGSFNSYPHRWLSHPDPNIDHRRVPNLMTFFTRNGETLPATTGSQDYSPGDIIAWNLGNGVTHIGLVVDQKSDTGRYMVVHNIGRGPQMEDVLFDWKVIGHYRYYGPTRN